VVKVDSGEASMPYVVEWYGADGRAVAYCFRRYEAEEIARLLNEGKTAAKWYKRAATALYIGGQPE